MTLAELQALNTSMDELARTFFQNRVLKAQEKRDVTKEELDRSMLGLRTQEAVDERGYRQGLLSRQDKAFSAQEARYGEQRAHEGRIETYQQNLLKQRQAQDAIEGLNKQWEFLNEGVKAGSIDPKEANARAKSLVKAIKDSPQLILQQTPFAALLEGGGDLFVAPPGRARDLKPWEQGTREITDIDPLTGEERTRRIRTLAPGEAQPEAVDPETKRRNAALERALGELQGMKARGVPEAKVTRDDKGNVTIKEGGVFTFGEKPVAAQIAGIEAELRAARKGQQRAGIATSRPTITNAPNEVISGDQRVLLKPDGKTDAELLQDAREALKLRPNLRKTIEDRLRAWGIDPAGL